ncbi:Nucleic-acid-binding protein from transposon X-element [Eumeta japonica]|uniref:Nucleic-acid-binding protein from transposon X-element n=1 Tax=Eumeta variegata TaxID=151549 RepID=A0A4C1Y6W5_EUMVA|nr:Nucleic-acid-binding protein from transposon X-element [Eumeta japonica]
MQQRCRPQHHDPPLSPQHMQPPPEQNTANTKSQDDRPQEAPRRAKGYPSIVRFLPATADEFRVTRDTCSRCPPKTRLSHGTVTPTNEQPTKVCVRGLPGDTNIQEIMVALQQLDFPATYARRIPPRRDRSGCLFFVQLEHLNEEERTRLYAVKELLNMPGVTMEAWRGEGPQCHRCQLFGHSSHNCHRPMRCVRCGGEHAAASCERPREEKPTCANCDGPHTANDRRCPVFAEARVRGLKPPQGKDLRRPEAKKALQDIATPETQCNGGRQHHYRENLSPRPIVKPKPIPAPTQGETTEQAQRAEATEPIEQPPTDSAPQGPTRHTQPKPKKGRRARRRERKMLQQQQQWQQQSTEPRTTGHPERRVREQTNFGACRPEPRNRDSNSHHFHNSGGRPGDHYPPHHIRPGPGGGQSKSSHVRDDKDTRHNTPLNQDWPGSDAGYSGRPDTRGMF